MTLAVFVAGILDGIVEQKGLLPRYETYRDICISGLAAFGCSPNLQTR
jgi:hypothetical protein